MACMVGGAAKAQGIDINSARLGNLARQRFMQDSSGSRLKE